MQYDALDVCIYVILYIIGCKVIYCLNCLNEIYLHITPKIYIALYIKPGYFTLYIIFFIYFEKKTGDTPEDIRKYALHKLETNKFGIRGQQETSKEKEITLLNI